MPDDENTLGFLQAQATETAKRKKKRTTAQKLADSDDEDFKPAVPPIPASPN
jgi:hypothetical protein